MLTNMQLEVNNTHLLVVGGELCMPPADQRLEKLRAHGVDRFVDHVVDHGRLPRASL